MGGANYYKGVCSFSRGGPRWCDGEAWATPAWQLLWRPAPKDVGGRQEEQTGCGFLGTVGAAIGLLTHRGDACSSADAGTPALSPRREA